MFNEPLRASLGVVRDRKWNFAALALFTIALCTDLIAKRLAFESAAAIDTHWSRTSEVAAVGGLLVALVGGACGFASVVKAEPGLSVPVIIAACSYLLVFLMMV